MPEDALLMLGSVGSIATREGCRGLATVLSARLHVRGEHIGGQEEGCSPCARA